MTQRAVQLVTVNVGWRSMSPLAVNPHRAGRTIDRRRFNVRTALRRRLHSKVHGVPVNGRIAFAITKFVPVTVNAVPRAPDVGLIASTVAGGV